jgi:hypothetical protein
MLTWIPSLIPSFRTTTGYLKQTPLLNLQQLLTLKPNPPVEKRIKAEHGESLAEAGAVGETTVAGTAAEGGFTPEAMAKAAAEAEPFAGAGPGQGPVPGQSAAQAAAGQAGVNSGFASAEAAAEEPKEEPKREPIYNPAVGRAKPKGEKVTDSNDTIQL